MMNVLHCLMKALPAAALVLACQALRADTITLDTNSYSDSSGGGEFTAITPDLTTSKYSASTMMDGGFETFCLSFDEEFSPGSKYNFTVGSDIMDPSFTPPASPLTIGTAYLYSQFAAGTLAGYDYAGGSGRKESALKLQTAIWWLQGEGTEGAPGATSYDPSNPFESLVNGVFGGDPFRASNGADGVDVLVLTNSNGSYSQPQLYVGVPDSGTTAALLGLGLVAIFGGANFRRARRDKAPERPAIMAES
jgi:hypothetical protein